MKQLNKILLEASKVYEQENSEIMSNFEYDKLYQELEELESETGIVLSDSVTQKVGYGVISDIPTKRHGTAMLSLEKTKSVDDLVSFLGNESGFLSWKLDGLTIVVDYANGELQEGLTRGNGEVGEVITNNVRTFKNIPLRINHKGKLTIRGEAVIKYSTFDKINSELRKTSTEEYKNPRNLCAGTVRQLNPAITKIRDVCFYAFTIVSAEGVDFGNSRANQLEFLEKNGFETVDGFMVNRGTLRKTVNWFENNIAKNDNPSDGLVLTFDNIEYGESLGVTSKTPKHSIAFKWEDDLYSTLLKDVIWQVGRTGVITPVAIFDTVNIDGTDVSKASLHNVSVLKALKIGIGDRVGVYKANMIIPQIGINYSQSDTFEIPEVCPVCGSKTYIQSSDKADKLMCSSENCGDKLLRKLTHFVSRNAMNIKGLSSATIEKMIEIGAVSKFSDLFDLEERSDLLFEMDTFGWKSYENLIEAVDTARYVDMPNFIFALGIPNIGLETAKLICEAYDYGLEDMASAEEDELDEIEGIGEILAESFSNYFMEDKNVTEIIRLIQELTFYTDIEGEQQTFLGVPLRFEYVASVQAERILEGMTFVCTGALFKFENRPAMKDLIEMLGGRLTGSVTGKTTYLITNDTSTGTVKNDEARRLGVDIITENEFIEKYSLEQYI